MENYLITPPAAADGEGYRGFIHVTPIDGPRFTGFQTKYARPHRAYVDLSVDSLIDALVDRNAYYQTVGYPASLLRKPMSLAVRDPSWPSGWRHITCTHDYYRKNKIEVMSANVPILETGRRTTAKWRVRDFATPELAAEMAALGYNQLARQYNRIAQLANQLQVDFRLHAAAQLEIATLRPWLKYQSDADGRIYREAHRRLQAMQEDIRQRWEGKGVQLVL